MAGDYTRFTFKPQRDYSGVFKQQGRVDLDADCNELIEIIDRRWRSETIDIISHCIVPNTTPDAFLITPTAMGAFDIGIGRMYVDGIQVENHGLPTARISSRSRRACAARCPSRTMTSPICPRRCPQPLAAARQYHRPRLHRRLAARGHRPGRSIHPRNRPGRARHDHTHAVGVAGPRPRERRDSTVAATTSPSGTKPSLHRRAGSRLRPSRPRPATIPASSRPAAAIAAWRTGSIASKSTPSGPIGGGAPAKFKWSQEQRHHRLRQSPPSHLPLR